MKFNSADCMKKGCFLHGKPYIEFAVGCKSKHEIRPNKSTGAGDIDIQQVSAKHFFQMARKKDHEGYLWVPKVSTDDCTKNCCDEVASSTRKWCASTINSIVPEDFDKFMKEKPEYTREELLEKVPKEYHSVINVFIKRETDVLPEHREKDHSIQLEEGKTAPFVQNYKPLSNQENDAMVKYIQENLGKGFVRPILSAAAAPVLLIRKPGGRLRFCVDYYALNTITVKNRYPIPLINKTLGKLANAVRFTKLDIIAAFNRIQIKEGQEWLTAFNTRHGQFEYLVMPFGLCNAPATFQSYINSSLREYLDVFCTAYLDDVLIYSMNKEEHTEQVLNVLKQLQDRSLQVNINKYEFSVTEVKYLGMIMTTHGIRINLDKIQAIIDWETPTLVKDVQAFLGFSNFYRRFISRFSQRTRPLNDMTKGSHVVT